MLGWIDIERRYLSALLCIKDAYASRESGFRVGNRRHASVPRHRAKSSARSTAILSVSFSHLPRPLDCDTFVQFLDRTLYEYFYTRVMSVHTDFGSGNAKKSSGVKNPFLVSTTRSEDYKRGGSVTLELRNATRDAPLPCVRGPCEPLCRIMLIPPQGFASQVNLCFGFVRNR